MKPVWERIARWAEKDFDEVKAKKEARTLRIPALLLLLAIGAAVIIGTGYMLTQVPMEGTYCGYPDPYGR